MARCIACWAEVMTAPVLILHAVESSAASADALLDDYLRDNFDAIDAELRRVR